MKWKGYSGKRYTAIGALLARDAVAGRAVLAEAIRDAGGNVRRAAFKLDIGQPWLCRLIVRHSLQDVVAEARKSTTRPDWLTRTRRSLSMDEQLQAIVDSCAGMSEDEICELVKSSSVASEFQDPGLIAAYVASLASGASAA